VESGYFCNTLASYHLHFVAVFDRPFASHGTWRQEGLSPGSSSCSGTFQVDCGAWVTFDTTTTPTVTMKVGVSYVSEANAKANLKAEDPGWSLSRVEDEATARWDAALAKIQVGGGTPTQRTTFYTALYHCLLDPSIFSDVNGDYVGFDGRVHNNGGRTQYANFSEWDIYRSEIPLLSMIDPSAVSDMMQSLVNDANQGGWLPVWEIADGDSGTMNGDSADPMIADAYAFGIRGFDAHQALNYMLKGAEQPGTGLNQVSERPYLEAYEKNGFIPAGDTNPNSATETVGASETLEYAVDDASIAQMAQALGDTSAERTMEQRSQHWQYLFDPTTGYVEARGANGSFPPGPAMQVVSAATQLAGVFQKGFAEGNAIQYTWSVPQNLNDLFALMGGDTAVTGELKQFFTSTNVGPWQPYDWSGNEPDLWVPWEFDYSGAPSDTQAAVRTILTTDYSNTPAGEPGNDDLGAMSSWYVWAALGLYPLTPGSADLAVASPIFPSASVHLGGSKVLRIEASGAPDTYVASATLALGRHAAQALARPWVPSALVEDGGTVHFVLASSPNQQWGSAPADAPPSYADGAAPAVGFTVPSGEVTVAPGASASVEVGAQSDTAGATTVDWKVAAPAGVRVSPSSGSVALPAETAGGTYGRATRQVAVEAQRSGTFDVHVTFSGPGGSAPIPPVTLVVDARQR
jgi:predicted alpha-1,2-mannosidase